ncbi:hypothetical protein H8K33_00495 [Undibacterium amnicola]|uniref:DUF3147 family protein n=1 Tax=Undibacterium amnicola TaxID=1834038 RepID=A0ABR6XKD8_9BURK|nr:hypothetical protein [Undibacterium amnicola]MBC3829980.1 hypothetical protein [Undibacterium amnicola]
MFNNEYSKKDKVNAKKYGNELGISIVIYMVVLFGSIYIAKPMENSLLRTLIVLTPTIPALGAFWAIIRHFQRMDEYMRVWLLEVIALAGGITAFFSFSYGFLEGMDYPKLSGFVIYVIFMGSWGLITLLRKYVLERE